MIRIFSCASFCRSVEVWAVLFDGLFTFSFTFGQFRNGLGGFKIVHVRRLPVMRRNRPTAGNILYTYLCESLARSRIYISKPSSVIPKNCELQEDLPMRWKYTSSVTKTRMIWRSNYSDRTEVENVSAGLVGNHQAFALGIPPPSSSGSGILRCPVSTASDPEQPGSSPLQPIEGLRR